MEPAVSRLEAALASTEIRVPRIPVISNVDAEPHASPDTIKKILARQVIQRTTNQDYFTFRASLVLNDMLENRMMA